MALFARIVKDINTIANGHDYCHSKVWSSIALLAYIAISLYIIYHGDKFDCLNWAEGAGVIIGAGAAGARIKNDTEPQIPQPQTTGN